MSAALAVQVLPGAALHLLADRAAFDPALGCLLIADAHIGKAQSFRRRGVPVPAGTTAHSLARLSALVAATGARQIVFLGDLMHSAHAQNPATMQAFGDWRSQHADLELTLVRGNHDDHAGDPPAILDIQAFDEPLRHGALAFCHHPQPIAGAYVLAGHLHPCVSVGGRAHDWHRLPCFWFSQQVGVLPAFGSFTGMQTIRTKQGERVFAAAAHRVFELQPKPKARALRTIRTVHTT